MTRRSIRWFATAAMAVAVAGPPSPAANALTFQERVAAQVALDRTYYSHVRGARRPFEEAVPRAVSEKKVRDAIVQSSLLADRWNTPVDADALQRELARIERDTRMPERLTELYAALDDDPLLVQECLARPLLVDRLARSFFAWDERLHATERRVAEELRGELAEGRIDPFASDPRRRLARLVRGKSETSRSAAGPSRVVGPDEFERWSASLPQQVGEVGPLVEERDAFTVSVLLSRSPDELQSASYRVEKRGWDEWWTAASQDVDLSAFETPALGARPTAVARVAETAESGGSADCVPVRWDNGSLDDLPDPHTLHTAVWTGSLMIVWGGQSGGQPVNTGARYDPVIDTWVPTTVIGAPTGRSGHSAVWTGDRMIVWGGRGGAPRDDGASYDPITDTWTPLALDGAPSAREGHRAVWTGSKMLVWGGKAGTTYLETGGSYDPTLDAWSPTSTTGVPAARTGHTAVWSGSRMVVWGGANASPLSSGGRYDPASDTWAPTSSSGAPKARSGHVAVWTGASMFVWGGLNAASTGGLYDPVADTWSPVSATNAPPRRYEHSAVWTGDRIVVWGGASLNASVSDTGGLYDPTTDVWTPTATTNAPAARRRHTAVWADGRMLVWGGTDAETHAVNSGGRYDPVTDSWTPTSLLSAPSGRFQHTAVWTGSQMVVWGGNDNYTLQFDTGGRYDPTTDQWTPTSTLDAPPARSGHTATWTGDAMVVWGGYDTDYLVGGGRYDPATDTWAPMSTSGEPTPRSGHTSLWADDRMIVWGGFDNVAYFDNGASYDPVADSWQPISTAGAPSPRRAHSSVWTGDRMIVWGGVGETPPYSYDTGGRYDPMSDSWQPTTLVDSPPASAFDVSVWTGSLMLVWHRSNLVAQRYDPNADAWTPMSPLEAPAPGGGGGGPTAVWTGNRMIVWGGATNQGGAYDPTTDSWTPTATANAPQKRFFHTAVWADDQMIVWGGNNGIEAVNSGGRYVSGPDTDADGDGVTACHGDCDDADPAVFGAPLEVRNVRWASKDMMLWDSLSPSCGNGTRYDVIYQALSQVRFTLLSGATCMQNDVTQASTLDTSPVPLPGNGWFFLVRGDNGCGQGLWHVTTFGGDVTVYACP